MNTDNLAESLTESAIERLHREMDAKDARIEELESALRDALTLLPPDRWRLLLPQYADTRQSVLDPDMPAEDFDHE